MNKMKNHKSKEEKLSCEVCAKKLPFRLPQAIIDSCIKGKLVIFAGAGISTERDFVFPYTFYDDVRDELKIKKNKNLSFAKLMSAYCKQPNGRAKLLLKIKERLEYIESFPELYRTATEFHRELSTIFQIKEIITTNWDNYFEKECAALPVVTPEDFVFWDNPGRKVFKIHGSINNYGSIIATEKDYSKCYKTLQKSIIGSNLKLLLATKTILFIGYSFGDEDFNKIYRFLKKEMTNVLPHSYLVTTKSGFNNEQKKSELTVINTDGTHFLSVLKHKLVELGEILPDHHYEKAYIGLRKIRKEHDNLFKKLNIKKNPETIYAASYQDGLIHGFERIIARGNSGEHSDMCYLYRSIKSYEKVRKDKARKKRYFDVAYIDGYVNAIMYFMSEELEDFPLYYVYNSKADIFTFKDYLKLSKKSSTFHKQSYNKAKKKAGELLSEDIVVQHTPFLL